MIASLVSTIDDEPECVAKISPKHECHQKNKQIQNKRTSSCQIIAKDLHHLIFRQNYSKKNTFNANDKIQFNVSDSIAFAPSPMIIIAPIKKNEKAEFYSALILRNKTDAIVKVFNGENRVDAGEAEKRTLEKIQQKLLNSKFNKNFCHMLGFCFLENGYVEFSNNCNTFTLKNRKVHKFNTIAMRKIINRYDFLKQLEF